VHTDAREWHGPRTPQVPAPGVPRKWIVASLFASSWACARERRRSRRDRSRCRAGGKERHVSTHYDADPVKCHGWLGWSMARYSCLSPLIHFQDMTVAPFDRQAVNLGDVSTHNGLNIGLLQARFGCLLVLVIWGIKINCSWQVAQMLHDMSVDARPFHSTGARS